MSEPQMWTERDIKSIAQDTLTEQNRRLNDTLDKLRDGAQASILSANILHGNPELGFKGVLSDLQERMAASEVREDKRDAAVLEFHNDVTLRLKRVEKGQHRFWRALMKAVGKLHGIVGGEAEEKKEHKFSLWKMGTVLGGLGVFWHVILRGLQACAHGALTVWRVMNGG